MKKTAMQLLQDKVDKMSSNNIEIVKIWIKEYMIDEKKQTIEAYDSALSNCEVSNGLEYYTNKFNKQ